jgi:Xaa-Pro aminopeptidase
MPSELNAGARLTATGCAARRRRLADWLKERQLPAAVITEAPDVYYFTGLRTPPFLPGTLYLDVDSRSILAMPAGYVAEGVDQPILYGWEQLGTRHPDIYDRMITALKSTVPRSATKLAVQEPTFTHQLSAALGASGGQRLTSVNAALAAMQSRKDADELAVIREAVRVNLCAYKSVRDAIHPGANELDVLAAGIGGAMRGAGEKVWHDGDYQCGAFNGPARNRQIKSGELYIVDAWTCYRGYWSDMSRTFAVGGDGANEQHMLFQHIKEVLAHAAGMLRPGVDGASIWRAMDEMIRLHPPLASSGLTHHGGHAIGLRAHEMPDVNLSRGGRIEAGQVVCLEPGGYFADARAGVRLENMYLVTETGSENLCGDDLLLHACY